MSVTHRHRESSRFVKVFGLILFLLLSSCQPPLPSYEGYGFLIIAPEEVSAAVESLAAYKRSKGFLVKTETLQDLLAQSAGRDRPEKIRNYLAAYSTTTA